MISFEWDPVKAASNLKKHGVGFELASDVFLDPDLVVEYNREKDGELRLQAVGQVAEDLLLMVVFTLRGHGYKQKIRIISARKANRSEKEIYAKI